MRGTWGLFPMGARKSLSSSISVNQWCLQRGISMSTTQEFMTSNIHEIKSFELFFIIGGPVSSVICTFGVPSHLPVSSIFGIGIRPALEISMLEDTRRDRRCRLSVATSKSAKVQLPHPQTYLSAEMSLPLSLPKSSSGSYWHQC